MGSYKQEPSRKGQSGYKNVQNVIVPAEKSASLPANYLCRRHENKGAVNTPLHFVQRTVFIKAGFLHLKSHNPLEFTIQILKHWTFGKIERDYSQLSENDVSRLYYSLLLCTDLFLNFFLSVSCEQVCSVAVIIWCWRVSRLCCVVLVTECCYGCCQKMKPRPKTY